MSPDTLVHFRCISSAHGRLPPAGLMGLLTLHEGQWAYCHSSAEDAHDWSPTGGVALQTLVVRERARLGEKVNPAPASAPAPAARAKPRASRRT